MKLAARPVCSSLLGVALGAAGVFGCSADGAQEQLGGTTTASQTSATSSVGGASAESAAASSGAPITTGAPSSTVGGGGAASATTATTAGTTVTTSTAVTSSEASATGSVAVTGAGGMTASGTTSGEAGTLGRSSTTGGSDPSDRSEAGTCQRWSADHANMDEGTWSGSVATCDPGDISPEGRANALRLYNLYRWLADLPSVETSPERDSLAQACALIMEANGRLSHDPDTDWECWTEAGAEGASSSNITTGASVSSVAGYMLDPGNETTLGHRRWILSNSLGPIGIGSTGNGASCMQNLGGEGDAGKEWVAWPPPGVFPMQAYAGGFGVTLNETGWSVQSDFIDLGDAEVVVTAGGETLPVNLTQLPGGYGSRYAIGFTPDGWEPEPGGVYSVTLEGIDGAISYDVHFVDCG